MTPKRTVSSTACSLWRSRRLVSSRLVCRGVASRRSPRRVNSKRGRREQSEELQANYESLLSRRHKGRARKGKESVVDKLRCVARGRCFRGLRALPGAAGLAQS